ncbi:MAG: DUF615 domain-containing protein [Marinobacter sp.]|nr:DUF615 domain-containing protein [Marinobacter sp.]
MIDYESDHSSDDEDQLISKSQLKREMQALQDMGKKMMELPQERVKQLPMSDSLRQAIEESWRIGQREARRRHLQLIGKLLRKEDDVESLITMLQALDSGSEEHTRRHHLAERWRDQLIAGDNDTLTSFVDYSPGCDIQHLRNLVRNAKRDQEKQKNTGAAKKLFRFLREAIDTAENPSGS